MIEFIDTLFILLFLVGHVKLYLDTGYQVPPELEKYFVDMPFGYAAFWDNGKFVKYIDLRQ